MPSPGEVLAERYELIEPIGSGGMAVVWRARDLRLQRPVAVKLLRPEYAEDDEFVRRFEFEARNAASLSHPNVAPVYDTDVDGEHRFIVMELVDGPSLAEVIAERGPIEPVVAVEIAAAAARALAAAHRRGLIHRDVKPANLLIGRDGRVRLADFGIARALTSNRVTQPGTVLGSIPYLSPEQARGDDATAGGDIFSLGVVLYELLTGSLPWDADTPAAMATVRLYTPAPAPSAMAGWLPDGLDSIVARALEVDASKRFPSARVFADALEGWSRRHRAAIGGRAGVGRATTALAGGFVPQLAHGAALATAAAVGVARPNPAAAFPLGRGSTKAATGWAGRDRPPGPVRPTSRPPVVPQAIETTSPDDRDERRRRGGWALAAAAALLVGAVVLAFFRSPSQSPVPSAGAGGAAGGPSPTVIAVLPTVMIAPSPSPTAVPTQTAAPTPSPAPTPRPPPPTPRPTPRPEPATGPGAAVVAFYSAVEDHDWETAIDLWSPSMQERYPPDEWLIGRFRRTTDIDVTRLRTVSVNEAAGTARVEVTIVEYRTVEPSPRTFSGAWDLRLIDGRWVLHDPDF